MRGGGAEPKAQSPFDPISCGHRQVMLLGVTLQLSALPPYSLFVITAAVRAFVCDDSCAPWRKNNLTVVVTTVGYFTPKQR
jgi:hypothetical protein